MAEYTATVSTSKLELTDRLRGKLIHKAGIDSLKKDLNACTYTAASKISFTSVTLRSRIERFSEQFVADAESELTAYFSFRNGRSLNVTYPDLLYFSKEGSEGAGYFFNKSVAAAIGEAMAGFLVQRLFNFIPQARPLGLAPDIIMQRDDEIAFVEAKALLSTGHNTLPRVVNDAAIDLMQFGSCQ